MKFSYSLKQKSKIAFLLFLIMACTILIRVLEDRSIKNMEKAFSSIYNDRLIPATDIFHISEKVYSKRLLLDTFLSDSQDPFAINDLKKKLAIYDSEIDSLLAKYSKTFLVSNEKNRLQELKTKLIENRTVEKTILLNAESLDKLALKKLFNSNFNTSFLDVTALLSKLTKIQTVVGEELQIESKKIVSGTNLYSTLQLILAIIIGVLIVSIIFASNVMNTNNDKFNLN